MYKRQRVKKLGRKKTHRESLVNNQLRALFEHGHVRTTTVKAGVLRTEAERILAKYSEELSFRRRIENVFGKKELVNSFIKYAKKETTGVKITKVGFRPGDMTEMSRVELINFKEKKVKKEESVKEEKKEDKKKEKKEIQKVERQQVKVEKPKKVVVSKERAKSRSGL